VEKIYRKKGKSTTNLVLNKKGSHFIDVNMGGRWTGLPEKGIRTKKV
jgi:hypothetical protein